MRKLFIFIIFFLAIIYYSCQRKGQTVFLSENLRFVQPDTTIHLNGKLLSFEDNPPIGISNINCIDSFLIFSLQFQSKDSPYFFKVYNKLNHKFLGNLISKGNGPDEFLSAVYRDQFDLSGDSIKIYLYDLSREQFYAINLTRSILKTKTKISQEFGKLPRWTLKAFHYHDSLLLLRRIDNTGLVYELFDSQKGEKIRQFPLYSVNIGRDNYDKFNSTDYLQFENQKIAMPMMFMNQVNILDLKEGNNKAITTKKNHPSWDNIKNKENSELNVYYINARITHDYIFALYLDQPILEWQNTPKKMSVHVFNWDGVFRYELLLDEYLMCIAIDESLKIMYGVTYEEELVTYDISKIIESGVSQ